MNKLSLIATILIVFTVGSNAQAVSESEAPSNPLELFATALITSGQYYKCGAQSCNKDSIKNSANISCEAIASVKALTEVTAESLAVVTNTAIKGSLAIEPKCSDSAYKGGCKKHLPHQISKLSRTCIKTGHLLECIENPTQEIVNQVNEYFIQFADILRNSEAEGLQCPNVMNRALKVLKKNLKKLCN